MKIAVPSDDRKSVAFHFGRAQGFLLFTVRDEIVQPATEMTEHSCECSSTEHPSRHERILDALAGCHPEPPERATRAEDGEGPQTDWRLSSGVTRQRDPASPNCLIDQHVRGHPYCSTSLLSLTLER